MELKGTAHLWLFMAVWTRLASFIMSMQKVSYLRGEERASNGASFPRRATPADVLRGREERLEEESVRIKIRSLLEGSSGLTCRRKSPALDDPSSRNRTRKPHA